MGTFSVPNPDFVPGSTINSSEVDENFGAPGLASQLNSQNIADDNITPGGITTASIADGTLLDADVSDADITAADLTVGIGNAKIQNDAIDQRTIADDAVGNPQMQDNSVDTAEIVDGAVTSAKLGSDVQFPVSVTDEVVQIPVALGSVALLSANVEPVNITVTGSGGAPTYVRGVDWDFVAPNLIQDLGGLPTLTDLEVDYTAAASGPPLNSVGSPQIIDDSIQDADINSAAGIQLSKLAVDPVDRANHTGTQAAATISDFATTTQGIAVGGDLTGTVGNAQIGSGTVGATEIGQLPMGTISRPGSGIPLATPGTWQNVRYPTANVQAGMATYNDGGNIAGFTIPVNGWYNITCSAEFTSASSTSATAIGVRVYNQTAGSTIAKDVQGWNGAAINPGAGCSVNAYLTAGTVIVGQFNAVGDNPVPDTESTMSIAWVSD